MKKFLVFAFILILICWYTTEGVGMRVPGDWRFKTSFNMDWRFQDSEETEWRILRIVGEPDSPTIITEIVNSQGVVEIYGQKARQITRNELKRY
jgi:hypothetical protein